MFLASRGRRERDAEGPPRFEGEYLVQLERQARRVWLLTLVTTLALTLAAAALAIATS